MLTSQRNVLKFRVGTFLGSMLLFSWTFGCGLVLWHASTDENPIANVLAKNLYSDAYLAAENY